MGFLAPILDILGPSPAADVVTEPESHSLASELNVSAFVVV